MFKILSNQGKRKQIGVLYFWNDNDLYVFGGHVNSEKNEKVYKLKKDEETWETLGVTLNDTLHSLQRRVFPAVTLSTIHCK